MTPVNKLVLKARPVVRHFFADFHLFVEIFYLFMCFLFFLFVFLFYLIFIIFTILILILFDLFFYLILLFNFKYKSKQRNGQYGFNFY